MNQLLLTKEACFRGFYKAASAQGFTHDETVYFFNKVADGLRGENEGAEFLDDLPNVNPQPSAPQGDKSRSLIDFATDLITKLRNGGKDMGNLVNQYNLDPANAGKSINELGGLMKNRPNPEFFADGSNVGLGALGGGLAGGLAGSLLRSDEIDPATGRKKPGNQWLPGGLIGAGLGAGGGMAINKWLTPHLHDNKIQDKLKETLLRLSTDTAMGGITKSPEEMSNIFNDAVTRAGKMLP